MLSVSAKDISRWLVAGAEESPLEPNFRPRTILAILLASIIVISAAPTTSAANGIPIIESVEMRDDSTTIWYNYCPVPHTGPPEGCTGPYGIRIPVGVNPDPCRPTGSTNVCDLVPDDPCRPTSSTNVCEPPCRVGTIDVCDPSCIRVGNVRFCDGECRVGNIDCANPEVCRPTGTTDVCQIIDGLVPDDPCKPTGSTDVCQTVLDLVPDDPCKPTGTTDVCETVGGLIPDDPCRPTGSTDVCTPPCRVGTIDLCQPGCTRVGNVWLCDGECRVGNTELCHPDPCRPAGSVDVCNFEPCRPTGTTDVCALAEGLIPDDPPEVTVDSDGQTTICIDGVCRTIPVGVG